MKKPWYLKLSNIISIIAIVFSISTGIYTIASKHREEIRSKKEELRGITQNLIDLRYEVAKIYASQESQIMKSDLPSINSKRQIFLEAAAYLIEQIPEQVSSQEYRFLAFEYMTDSNYEDAEKYYMKAIDVSRSNIAKIFSNRELGEFYFNTGKKIKGRDLFNQAVLLSKEPSDPYSLYTKGFTYERWGYYELWLGEKRQGQEYFKKALDYYLKIPNNYPYSRNSISRVNKELINLKQDRSE